MFYVYNFAVHIQYGICARNSRSLRSAYRRIRAKNQTNCTRFVRRWQSSEYLGIGDSELKNREKIIRRKKNDVLGVWKIMKISVGTAVSYYDSRQFMSISCSRTVYRVECFDKCN